MWKKTNFWKIRIVSYSNLLARLKHSLYLAHILNHHFLYKISDIRAREPEMKGRSEAHEPSQDIGGRAAVLVDTDLPIGQHRLLFYIPAISLDE